MSIYSAFDLAVYMALGGSAKGLRARFPLLSFLIALHTSERWPAQTFRKPAKMLGNHGRQFANYMLSGAVGAGCHEPVRPLAAARGFMDFFSALGEPDTTDIVSHLMSRADEPVPGCVTGTIRWQGETRRILLWKGLSPLQRHEDYHESVIERARALVMPRRLDVCLETSKRVARLTWGLSNIPFPLTTPLYEQFLYLRDSSPRLWFLPDEPEREPTPERDPSPFAFLF